MFSLELTTVYYAQHIKPRLLRQGEDEIVGNLIYVTQQATQTILVPKLSL